MAKTEYQKKLLDPRWQKKRLQILERDEWKCQKCEVEELTLHVHHKYYNGCDPWDIPDRALVTLCEDCHADESEYLKRDQQLMLETMSRVGALSCDFHQMAEAFHQLEARGRYFTDYEWGPFFKWLRETFADEENLDQFFEYMFEEWRKKRSA